MDDVLSIYKDSVNFIKKRNSRLIDDGGSDKECIEAMIRVLDRYNLFLLFGEGYEIRIWNDLLNENDKLKTFLIDETTYYIKNNINSKNILNSLIEHIAFSHCILKQFDSGADTAVIGGLPNTRQAIVSLKKNPWLLYLSLFIDSFNN